jgi:hypothetical protein
METMLRGLAHWVLKKFTGEQDAEPKLFDSGYASPEADFFDPGYQSAAYRGQQAEFTDSRPGIE